MQQEDRDTAVSGNCTVHMWYMLDAYPKDRYILGVLRSCIAHLPKSIPDFQSYVHTLVIP